MDTSEKTFNIVKASAGSGKTYRLVKEYIALMIKEDYSKSFSKVIAMTFTNKAAIEMKQRIVSGLDTIASPSTGKKDNSLLMLDLAKELNLKPKEVQRRCGKVLQSILHQYEDFNVMTIDKFNLRLIRSFSRDLDLGTDFDVIMEESEVIEKIVDGLLNKIGDEDSHQLSELLFKYAKSNLEEETGWDFRRKLVEFGKILSSEKNRENVKSLMEVNFSTEMHGVLQGTIKTIDKLFLQKAQLIRDLFDNGTVSSDDLPGKSKTLSRIDKFLDGKTFFTDGKAPIHTDAFHKMLEKENYPTELRSLLLDLEKYWKENIDEYVSTKLFLSNFFNMALLQYMASSLEDVKKEEQMILISEFSKLISDLIQNEHTPFIYERLGTRFQHFLLDEFQDTSHLQWLNLVPLIDESIGNGRKNLIVGDAKQSIYRFKNGLAEQFITLPSIYNPDNIPSIASKSALFENAGIVEELEYNYRSSPTIVNFNNQFFEQLKNKMNPTTANYYNSIFQTPKSNKNGLIEIISDQRKPVENEIIHQIDLWIKQCQADGFELGEICILGNKNKECNQWAIALTELDYKIVSADSLLIDTDICVKLTIAFLKWRLSSGENEKKHFAEIYFRWKKDAFKTYQQYIIEVKTKDEKKIRVFDDNSFLENHFGSYEAFFFKYESIYDLVQGFYRLTNFNELENVYLHHLADITFDFELKRGPNLRGFIDDYQRRKHKIAVQIPESSDAIKIMTFHKSKGLEFPIVIMPSVDAKMDVKSSFLINIEDKIIYKTPSGSEVLKPLIDIYESESEQVITDYINICYVGMTRPIERLFILNLHDKKGFGTLFHMVLGDLPETIQIENTRHVLVGDKERSKRKENISEITPFTPHDIKDKLWFPDIALQDHDDLYDEKYLSSEMQFGIQFHLLASKIDHVKDIEAELEEHIQRGEVDHKNKTELKEKLTHLLNTPEYLALYDNNIEILNEQDILVNENSVIRPDKIIIKQNETIIIDYKTGLPGKKDIKQILEYKMTLDDMDYPNVKCYLFYSAIGELRLVG